MDTVGTFEMATALASEKIMTAIHKHYSIEEWSAFLENSPESIYQYIAISSGTGNADEEKIKQIIGKFPK
jgi:GMP reductase